MFNYLDYDEKGEKVVTRIDGVNSEMLMDITTYKMKAGDKKAFEEKDKETAILLLEGNITFSFEGRKEKAGRKNVFEEAPYCLHMCRGGKAEITADSDCEILVQSTLNERSFETKFYTPKECKIELMGDKQWEGTAKREVLTIFDYQNAPYSNMVIGEVITKAGRWSSYIPHSHRQPETYYYKFDHPQGFGGCFIGDNAFKVKDGSASCIPGGLTHPQTAAPGYNMYYCWMIRHLENDPWTSRDNDPAHTWLLEQ
ncbi:MAG: 5-deoxy-glucuronate isomerase [Lachnospiraceae bacterium]|nr:5-deoxy-glucuronate isomerase [Lachnospiraceae bacterium]